MYNIYYNLYHCGTDGYKFDSSAKTIVDAFMDAIREMRKVLSTSKVELVPLNDTEFVIWAFGIPQGYLSINEVGPKTQELGLCHEHEE